MPRCKRLVRYRENRAVETAFSDFDLNSRDDWEAVIKAAGGLKIHVKVLSRDLRFGPIVFPVSPWRVGDVTLPPPCCPLVSK
jgi:hypothetical protein